MPSSSIHNLAKLSTDRNLDQIQCFYRDAGDPSTAIKLDQSDDPTAFGQMRHGAWCIL